MTSADLHTMTGAYALDALDDDERAGFEAHLRDCSACRTEVAELSATTARLASAVAVPAPAGLRQRVLEEVGRTRQLPPVRGVVRDLRPARWFTQLSSLAAALLLVVSAGLGALAWSEARQAQRSEQRAEQIAAIAAAPDAVRTVVRASGGGHGTVLAADGRAFFRTTALPELPGEKVYQLWVIEPSGPESAGVLGSGGALEALVTGVDSGDDLGLTIEPAGGSPKPTGELVILADLA